jgi:hypothetical protein
VTPRVPKCVVDEAEQEIQDDATDEVAARLAALGSELQAVATDRVKRSETLKQIEDLLGNLKIKDYQELAESPVVQSLAEMLGFGDARPGQVIGKGTLLERVREWTWKDVAQQRRVKFIPAETIPITYNGLTIQLVQDVECEVPEGFYNIYREHREAIRQAQQNERYLLGHTDVPPDPNWLTEESAKIRLWSTHGRPYGRPSGTLGVGRIYDSEEERGGQG